jgi:flagellar biosynthesis chaperone FliJ
LELDPPSESENNGEVPPLSEEHTQLLEQIKDAEEELNFLAEYEELLQCDLEETKNGGVYGDIFERLQQQISKAENIVDILERSTDGEADSQDA